MLALLGLLAVAGYQNRDTPITELRASATIETLIAPRRGEGTRTNSASDTACGDVYLHLDDGLIQVADRCGAMAAVVRLGVLQRGERGLK